MVENVTNIMTEIKDIASGILVKNVSAVRGFSERQLEAIAKQTAIIQNGVEAVILMKTSLSSFWTDWKQWRLTL